LGTVRFSTMGSSSCRTTSCSSSEMSCPESASSRLASVIGSLDPHPLEAHRNRLRHLLGDDILAQAGPSRLALLGADAQLPGVGAVVEFIVG
jgi:hypothetical protein